MPVGNICNGISFRHDDSVLRSFSGAVHPEAGRGGAGRHWSVSAAHACATPSPAVPAAALPITPHVSPELLTALSLLASCGRLSLVPAWPGCAARSAAAASPGQVSTKDAASFH